MNGIKVDSLYIVNIIIIIIIRMRTDLVIYRKIDLQTYV